MRKIPFILSIAVVLSVLLSLFALPSAGLSGGDSLLTKSYIDTTVTADLKKLVEQKAATGFSSDNTLITKVSTHYDSLKTRLSKAGLAETLASAAAEALQSRGNVGIKNTVSPITLNSGDSLKAEIGSTVLLLSGAAKAGGTGTILNLTKGETVSAGAALSSCYRYLQSEKVGSTVIATKDNTVLYVSGSYRVTRADAYTQENVDMAFALRQMHLMSGTGNGFKLTKKTTRDEALIFMLNYMGLTEEAAKTTGACPFKDVASWFKPYVTYAYNKGLVAGTSATTYNPNDPIAPDSFVTLFLRCLGYSDTNGKDFTYKTAIDKAISLGILTANERTYLRNGTFVRDKAVYVCYSLLDAKNTSGKTFSQLLIEKGIFTKAEETAARKGVTRTKK